MDIQALATFLLFAAVLLGVSMAGACVPFVRKLSDDQIHLLIALSAGIFLGIFFLMLMPEALHESREAGHEEMLTMVCVLGGFIAILLLDVLIKHFHMRTCACECSEDEHVHSMASLSAFIGLSVHACADGLALAATLVAGEEVGLMALLGMCIHKFVVLFSLSSTFLLTDQTRRRSLTFLLAFSLITPISGIVCFAALNGVVAEGVAALPLAFAAGTFMFVAFCDMLPEAFHRKSQDLKSFLSVAAGIAVCAAVVVAVHMMGGHVHRGPRGAGGAAGAAPSGTCRDANC